MLNRQLLLRGGSAGGPHALRSSRPSNGRKQYNHVCRPDTPAHCPANVPAAVSCPDSVASTSKAPLLRPAGGLRRTPSAATVPPPSSYPAPPPRSPSAPDQSTHPTSTHTPRPSLLTTHELQALASQPGFPALLTTQIKLCTAWTEVRALFDTFSHLLNHVHISAILTHLPRVASRPALRGWELAEFETFLFDLGHAAEQALPDCRPRELANIAHSFAHLGAYSKRLTQLLVGRALHFTLAAFKPQELSNFFWALSTLNHTPPPQLLTALEEALATIPPPATTTRTPPYSPAPTTAPRQHRHHHHPPGATPFKPQELSSLAYALATLPLPASPSPALLASLTAHITPLLPAFESQALANTLWAFAALRHTPPPPTLDALLSRTHALLPTLPEPHLAQIAYALYALSIPPPEPLLHALLHSLPRRAPSLAATPRHLCMVLLPIAQQTSACHPPDSRRPAARPTSCPLACSPTIHRALTDSALPALVAAAAPRLPTYAPADIATLLLCLAHCSYTPPAPFLTACLTHLHAHPTPPTPQDISNTLWALARMHYRPPLSATRTLGSLGGRLVTTLDAAIPQNLANAIWALGFMRVFPSWRWLSLLLKHLTANRQDSIVLPCHVAAVVWSLPRLVKQQAHAAFVQVTEQELRALEELSGELLPRCGVSELVQLAGGFKKLGWLPQEGWRAAYAAAAAAALGGEGVGGAQGMATGASVGSFEEGVAAAVQRARERAGEQGGRVGRWRVRGPEWGGQEDREGVAGAGVAGGRVVAVRLPVGAL